MTFPFHLTWQLDSPPCSRWFAGRKRISWCVPLPLPCVFHVFPMYIYNIIHVYLMGISDGKWIIPCLFQFPFKHEEILMERASGGLLWDIIAEGRDFGSSVKYRYQKAKRFYKIKKCYWTLNQRRHLEVASWALWYQKMRKSSNDFWKLLGAPQKTVASWVSSLTIQLHCCIRFGELDVGSTQQMKYRTKGFERRRKKTRPSVPRQSAVMQLRCMPYL